MPTVWVQDRVGYLSMKEGNLFCFVLQLRDPLNQNASGCVLGVFGKLWKALDEECMGLVP